MINEVVVYIQDQTSKLVVTALPKTIITKLETIDKIYARDYKQQIEAGLRLKFEMLSRNWMME